MKKKRKPYKFIILIIIVMLLMINIVPITKTIYPIKYTDIVYKYSKEYNLKPMLVFSVIQCESKYDSKAKSNKNAYGLMQIQDSTAIWAAQQIGITNFKVEDLYQPEINIRIGCWYINELSKEFDNKMDLVLSAYNAGSGNVTNWLKSKDHSKDGKDLYYIPYKETDRYVKKVKFMYSLYSFLYNK
ncbi:MAG TPA: lytic transglycosylase domain-containing protein [Clostridiaceae bacterium]